MMFEPIFVVGKQLLQGSEHLADVRDEAAAAAIALVLNKALLIMPSDEETQILRGLDRNGGEG